MCSLKQSILNHNGTVVRKFDDLLDQRSLKIEDPEKTFIIIKQDKRDFKEATLDIRDMIHEFKITYETFD